MVINSTTRSIYDLFSANSTLISVLFESIDLVSGILSFMELSTSILLSIRAYGPSVPLLLLILPWPAFDGSKKTSRGRFTSSSTKCAHLWQNLSNKFDSERSEGGEAKGAMIRTN